MFLTRDSLVKPLTNFIILFLLFITNTVAQESTNLQGTITDPASNVVVNAEVLLTDKDGRTVKTMTDRAGNYLFKSLSPGSYKLQIKTDSFAPFSSELISLIPGRTHSYNVQLQIKQIEENVGVNTDDPNASLNKPGGEMVIKGNQLKNLPDDPKALAEALKAMAISGPGDPQIYVDDYASSKPPPKQSIREVRISQNFMSADQENPGGASINIYTKVGNSKLQGNVFFNFSDRILNSRNPFASERPPYTYRQYGFFLSRSIVAQKSAFSLSFDRLDENRRGIITAQSLDTALNITPLRQSIKIPLRDMTITPRFDFQINENNTLVIRYIFNRTTVRNLGVGELYLPSRGYDYKTTEQTFRLTETAVLNPQSVNEFRFQFVHGKVNQIGQSNRPAINVQDAFFGGDSTYGQSGSNRNYFELTDNITINSSSHLTRFGVKVRHVKLENISSENFNGIYTFTGRNVPLLDVNNQIILNGGQPQLIPFTSLEVYRRTLLLQRAGFTPADIRLRGGGATQFSLSKGDSKVKVNQTDFGVFVQDEWRIKPNFNLYLGLRYEGQTNIRDFSNIGPRVAFAWAPKVGKEQKSTFRGGIGLYYGRVDESNSLQVRRFNGTTQQRFISSADALVDFFPSIPPSNVLSGFLSQQAVSKLADNLTASRTFMSLLSFEHKFAKNTTFYSGLATYRTRHIVRQRNINAPLPGTFIFGQPGSGIRPFGNVGETFLIESSGDSYINQLYLNLQSRISQKISISTRYTLTDSKDSGGASSFPADSYNTAADWGRPLGVLGSRHRVNLSSTIEVPKLNITWSPNLVFFSPRRFDIVTGLDTNGDQIFQERPSLASSTNGPNVIQTPYGIFNIIPVAGEKIIPRNYGRTSAFFSANMGLSKVFTFGKGENSSGNSNSESRTYQFTLSAQIENLFNKRNLAPPIGSLTSPLFGKSTTIIGPYGWVEDNPAFNRKITIQFSFDF